MGEEREREGNDEPTVSYGIGHVDRRHEDNPEEGIHDIHGMNSKAISPNVCPQCVHVCRKLERCGEEKYQVGQMPEHYFPLGCVLSYFQRIRRFKSKGKSLEKAADLKSNNGRFQGERRQERVNGTHIFVGSLHLHDSGLTV